MSASSGKSKFFGFLKNVFQKSSANDDATPVSTQTEEPLSLHGAPPIETAPRPAAALPPRRTQNGQGKAASGPAPAANAARGVAVMQVSLQGIINTLPLELRGKVVHADVGAVTVAVPLDKVLSQLSQGVVKIPFGDVRQAAPYAFTSEPDSDRIAVMLPLNEILSQLNPALLVRRSAQKNVEVPPDITSPFDGKGDGVVFSVGNNAKPVAPASPRQVAPAPATPARGSISSVPLPPPPAAAAPSPALPPTAPIPMRKVAPSAAAPAAPNELDTPIFPIPQKKPATPTPAAQSPSAPIAFNPNSPISPLVPAHPFGAPTRPAATPAPIPSAQPIQFSSAQPAAPAQPARPAQPTAHAQPARAAQPQPQAQAAASDAGSLTVPLKAVADGWPEPVRQEIAQTGLAEARIALPCDAIEPALKRGRAAFPWKTLRSWIRPAAPPSTSVHDSTELELPLRVVAPLFLARQNTKAAPKQAIDETIPNLFFGFPKTDAAATPPPQPPPQQSLPKPSSSAVNAAGNLITSPNKPTDTNFYVWNDTSDTTVFDESEAKKKAGPPASAKSGGTEFINRYATPNEIVSRAAALDGVAGALIALPDGLMVASRLSPEVNGDTLAAFLPQIFAKVNQCTRELRMGELNNLNFTVGNIPWKIFRVNAIFFAAFGRVAEPLPTADLAALAAELDRKR